MKKLTDILQIALTMPDGFGYLASVLLLLVVWQVGKFIAVALRDAGKAAAFIRRRLIRVTWLRMGMIAVAALPLYAFRFEFADTLQLIEQRWNPAYITGDTSTHALAAYEAELSRHTDAYESEIIRRRTREIAAKLGCSPLAIYEVAYSECGLDPFRVRRDGVAAGWIQFTRAGLVGITHAGGASVSLDDVKTACMKRDAAGIMNWTSQYLVGRAAGKPLPDATAVYVATFAPAHIGAPDDKVLYSGYRNPEYYMNQIFDGYYTAPGSSQIFRRTGARDGRITIRELRLHLEAKKARLLKK